MDPWDGYIISLTPPLILENGLTRASLPTKLERQGYSFLILRLLHYPDDLLINTGGPHPPFSAKWMWIAMHSCSGRGGGQGVSPAPQAPRGRLPWVFFFHNGNGPCVWDGQEVAAGTPLLPTALRSQHHQRKKKCCCPQPLTFPILLFIEVGAAEPPANCKIQAKGERLCACALQSKRENVFRSALVSSDLSISYF